MKIKRFCTFSLEIGDDSFEIPFDVSEWMDPLVWISPDGQTAIIGTLSYDDSPADPFEEFDEGEFYQFESRYIHYRKNPGIEEFKRICREYPNHVVTHSGTADCHGPGTSAVFPYAVITPAMCRGDKWTGENSPAEFALDDSDGYYIVPDDVPVDRVLDYAKGALSTYEAFCNGDVWGVCVWTYNKADENEYELIDRDECWGFYGSDYAKEELQRSFDYTVNAVTTQAA